jgi:hypothetical protein
MGDEQKGDSSARCKRVSFDGWHVADQLKEHFSQLNPCGLDIKIIRPIDAQGRLLDITNLTIGAPTQDAANYALQALAQYQERYFKENLGGRVIINFSGKFRGCV